MADIPQTVLDGLNNGSLEAVTLVECLAVDYRALFAHAVPDADTATTAAMAEMNQLKITGRMNAVGALLLKRYGFQKGYRICTAHRSDTVRSWAASLIGAESSMSLADRLRHMVPLADDPNPGVREWAWLALRPHIIATLEHALALLEPWTREPSANLRRFATESTRPRGVWCAHIETLKSDPARALPLLEPLRADPARYVQDSVANWLNDASKTQPAWVRSLCQIWLKASPDPATARICRRAQRTLDR